MTFKGALVIGSAYALLTLFAQEVLRPHVDVNSIDPLTISLIGGMIVTIIGTIVTGIVTVINAVHMRALSTQQAIATTDLKTVARDTEAIKGHVNSEKTAAEGREAALRKENEMLREIVAEKKMTAQLLAQAAAGRPVASDVAPMTGVAPVIDATSAAVSLNKIDEDTKAIERNTAKDTL